MPRGIAGVGNGLGHGPAGRVGTAPGQVDLHLRPAAPAPSIALVTRAAHLSQLMFSTAKTLAGAAAMEKLRFIQLRALLRRTRFCWNIGENRLVETCG